jgi:hypothetical protein
MQLLTGAIVQCCYQVKDDWRNNKPALVGMNTGRKLANLFCGGLVDMEKLRELLADCLHESVNGYVVDALMEAYPSITELMNTVRMR